MDTYWNATNLFKSDIDRNPVIVTTEIQTSRQQSEFAQPTSATIPNMLQCAPKPQGSMASHIPIEAGVSLHSSDHDGHNHCL